VKRRGARRGRAIRPARAASLCPSAVGIAKETKEQIQREGPGNGEGLQTGTRDKVAKPRLARPGRGPVRHRAFRGGGGAARAFDGRFIDSGKASQVHGEITSWPAAQSVAFIEVKARARLDEAAYADRRASRRASSLGPAWVMAHPKSDFDPPF